MQVLQGPDARAALTRSFNDIPVPGQRAGPDRKALFGEALTPQQVVERILADVRARGDDALRDWTERLDGPRPEALAVGTDGDCGGHGGAGLHAAIRLAIARVRTSTRSSPRTVF